MFRGPPHPELQVQPYRQIPPPFPYWADEQFVPGRIWIGNGLQRGTPGRDASRGVMFGGGPFGAMGRALGNSGGPGRRHFI